MCGGGGGGIWDIEQLLERERGGGISTRSVTFQSTRSVIFQGVYLCLIYRTFCNNYPFLCVINDKILSNGC